ncbi:MAG: hypothetical protein JO283_22145 [Bradyrhizobium sp.]|nr:hypothetical protein [Bradyrhizobium sp.]
MVYIRAEVLGPIVMAWGSFVPFQSTYYLNGHSFIEHQHEAANVDFRKDESALSQLETWRRCKLRRLLKDANKTKNRA